MRDLVVTNYRGIAQTTISKVATADVRLLAESTDEDLLPALRATPSASAAGSSY